MNQSSNTVASRANRLRRERRVAAACGVVTLLLSLSVTGCQLLGNGEVSQNDYEAMTRTDSIVGPLARAVQSSLSTDGQASVATPEVSQSLDEAKQLLDAGRYDEAAKRFRRIAKEQKLTAFGEEAAFLLGETYFRQQRYAYAQDAYDRLLEDYPSTRHVSTVTRRLFAIARTWLGESVPTESGSGIQLAGHEAESESESGEEAAKIDSGDLTVKIPLLPNLLDKRRPVFDTRGRALQALKSIWLNDPTGPLADDALMMTASYFLRKGDHIEADRYYKILREEYPKSPHLEKAFLLGSHVKLMSYQGPYYEGNTLEEAKKLKETTLRLFPDNSERTRLREELNDIYKAEAQRLWARVEYYQKKGRPRAVAISCRELIRKYPESEWAQRARQILEAIPKDQLGDLPGF